MIYGDAPVKANENNSTGATLYTYAPNATAIAQSGNLYIYCMNSPVTHIDSTGFWTIAIGAEASAAFREYQDKLLLMIN